MAKDPVALVVNAGGQSRRMGRNKALLPLPPNGEALVASILRRLMPLADDVRVVVTNEPSVALAAKRVNGTKVIADRSPPAGSLGGLLAGLAACQSLAMIVACDMPFVDPAIFTHLIEVARVQPKVDSVIPLIGGQPQPFHGVWRRSAMPRLEAQIATGELAIYDSLAKLNVVWMDEDLLGVAPEHWAFFNANTPDEWEQLLAHLREA